MKKEIVGVRVKSEEELKAMLEVAGGNGNKYGWADYIVSGMWEDCGKTVYGKVHIQEKKNENGSQRVTVEGLCYDWDERWLNYIYADDMSYVRYFSPSANIIGYRIKSKDQMSEILGIPKDKGHCMDPHPGWNADMWKECGMVVPALTSYQSRTSVMYTIGNWNYKSDWLEVLYIDAPVVVVKPVVEEPVVVVETETESYSLRGDQFIAVVKVLEDIEGTSVKVTGVTVNTLADILANLTNRAGDDLTKEIIAVAGMAIEYNRGFVAELVDYADYLTEAGDIIPAEWLTVNFEVTSRVNL